MTAEYIIKGAFAYIGASITIKCLIEAFKHKFVELFLKITN